MNWNGILLTIMGILMVTNPKVFRGYFMSDIMEGKKPSEGWLKFNRIIGVGIVLLGLLCLLGVI